MIFTRIITMTSAAIACAPIAYAHEFWIDPPKFQVENDAPFVADLRNGELFQGTAQSFFESRNTRFEVSLGGQNIQITGRMGDRPAIQLPAPGEDGLMVIVHEAAPSTVSYAKWEKFMSFVAHKDFQGVEALQTQRGWAKENFKELYTRHSKSLVAIGGGEGADRAFGLATEFVALDNPYAADFDGTLDVALLYDGAPRGDAQIEVYARDKDDTVVVTKTRTDAMGLAAIPVDAGTEYLLDAVVLRPLAGATTVEAGPVWETLWATLTFAVPSR